jgi:putative transposase
MKRKNKTIKKVDQEIIEKVLDCFGQEITEPNLMALLRHGAQELLKEAVKAEVTEYLGRTRYQHLQNNGDFKGERNGFRKTTIDTPNGQIVYERQRVARAPDFQSKYHVPHMRRPEEFSNMVAEMYINGVSTRKVKRALKAVSGEKVRMSRSTVSRVTKRLRDEFQQWKQKDLSKLKVAYLFLDAIRLGMRLNNSQKESVLIAYAVLEDGKMETISIGLGHSESNQIWDRFIGDLKKRGLRDPLLVISDGNPGVINAIDKNFPLSYRQRCVRHKIENILEGIPKENHVVIRKKLDFIFYGASSLEQAKKAIANFKKEYGRVYKTAVECMERDIDQCLTYFLFPAFHWKRIRTSNKLERMNLEIKRRIGVIGRHPSEEGCLSLVYQVTKRYAEGRQAFKVDELAAKLWSRLKKEKIEMIKQLQFDLKVA